MTDRERASLKNALCWAILVLWIAIVIWRKVEVRRQMVDDASGKAQRSLIALKSAKKNLAELEGNAGKLTLATQLGLRLLEKRQGQQDTLASLTEIAALAKSEGIRYRSVSLSSVARRDPLAGPLLRFSLDGSYREVRRFLWRLETCPTISARIVSLKLKGGRKGKPGGVTGSLTLNLRTGWKAGIKVLEEVTANAKQKAGGK